MKKISLALLTLLLFTFYGISQKALLSEEAELIKLKKELVNNIKNGNENHIVYGVSSTTGLKSIQGDFGDPPDWDWITTFGGSGNDVARKVAIASDGSLFVTGSFSGEISLGPDNYSSVGRRDAFLAKFQNDGSLIWFNQFSPLPGERINAYGIHLDDAGIIYFTGYYSGDVSFGDFDLPGLHGKNLFLVSANPDGEITMATAHPTANPEELGLKVDTDNDGNIFVLGSTDGTTNFRHPSVIIKYAPDGAIFFDYYHDQNFCDMKIIGEHIYFAGAVNSPDYIGDFYLEPMGYGDAFIAKSNTSLTFTWAEMGGHTELFNGDSYGIALHISADEEIFLLGQFRENLIWGTFEVEGYGGFITKCSSDGEFLWLSETTESNADTPTDITGNDESIFISTLYYSNIPTNLFQIRTFDQSNGMLLLATNSDSRIENVSYSIIDNSLALTQSANGQIRISMLDGTSLNSEWSFLFGGNSASAYGIGMDVDQYGFQYNFGYTSNQIDYFGQTINNGLFLIKQDGTGSTVWAVQFPGADNIPNDLGNYIAVDTITNTVYITGMFYNPLVIPGGPTLIPDLEGSIFILKYDFDGNYQWAVQEDFTSSKNLCLSNDYSGNVLLSGTFYDSIIIGSSTLISAGIDDAFIAKYDNSGQFIWAKRAGGEEWEWDALISTDGQDNVYLTGEFDSHDVTVDDFAITLEEGDGNILFAKFDPQGNVQWVTVKGGSSVTSFADYYGWPTGIHTDFEGYSYIKGWCNDSAYFDNILLTSSFNNPDYNNRWNKFVAKFDPDGNSIWATSISELSYSYDYNQFDVDQNGNVYSGLRVRDTTLFGDDFIYVNTGKYDLLVVNYSNDGELNWVKSIEGSESGSAWMSSIACYDEETAYVCGWFDDYLNFGTTSFEVNNKNGFIGVLGEITGITVYQRDDETLLFDLFPNPAHLEVNILLNDDLVDQANLSITNITGIELYSRPLTSGQVKITIDLSGFNPGIYFAKLKSGKKVAVKKFIVD